MLRRTEAAFLPLDTVADIVYAVKARRVFVLPPTCCVRLLSCEEFQKTTPITAAGVLGVNLGLFCVSLR